MIHASIDPELDPIRPHFSCNPDYIQRVKTSPSTSTARDACCQYATHAGAE